MKPFAQIWAAFETAIQNVVKRTKTTIRTVIQRLYRNNSSKSAMKQGVPLTKMMGRQNLLR